MTAHQQNPDGTWSPAEPLPWRGGPYWEVYADRAELVGREGDLAVVRSRWRWLLRVKMIVVSLRHVAKWRATRA